MRNKEMLIKDFLGNISRDLWSLIILFAGLGLLSASGVLFVSRRMSLQGDPSAKLFVLSLLGVGVVSLFLGIRIKANKPVSIKGWIYVVIIPVALSLIALLIYWWCRYYPAIIWAYIMYASGVIYLIFNTFMSLTERVKEVSKVVEIEEKNLEAEEIPIAEEKWRPIFTGLDNIGREASEIRENISNISHVHRQLKAMYRKNLKNIVDIYMFAMMLEEVPKEYIEPFRAKLWEVLEGCGVEKWTPKVGEPAPDGCNKKPASKEYPYPGGAVAKVHSPGFRTHEGEIIEPPLVEVVTVVTKTFDNQNLKEV